MYSARNNENKESPGPVHRHKKICRTPNLHQLIVPNTVACAHGVRESIHLPRRAGRLAFRSWSGRFHRSAAHWGVRERLSGLVVAPVRPRGSFWASRQPRDGAAHGRSSPTDGRPSRALRRKSTRSGSPAASPHDRRIFPTLNYAILTLCNSQRMILAMKEVLSSTATCVCRGAVLESLNPKGIRDQGGRDVDSKSIRALVQE